MKIFWLIFLLAIRWIHGFHVTDQDLIYMNLTVDPCEDFYQYTCGNFKNLHPLQEEDSLIDHFTILENELTEIGIDILEARADINDPVAVIKAKSAYEACIDHDFTDAYEMISPEVLVIEKYNGFPVLGEDEKLTESGHKFDWYDIADIATEFGIGIYFTPSLYFDTQNATRSLLRFTVDSLDTPAQIRPDQVHSYEEAIEEGFKFLPPTGVDNRLLTSDSEDQTPAMEVLLRKLVLKLKRVMGSDRSDQCLFEKVANISSFLKGIYYGGYIPNDTVVGPITNDSTAMMVTLKQLNEWTVEQFGNSIKLDWVEYVSRLLQYTHVEVDENFLVVQPLNLNTLIYGILNWVRMYDEEIVKSAALLRAFIYTAPDSDSETRRYFEDYLRATKAKIYPRREYCARKIMDTTGTLSLGLAVAYEYQRTVFDNTKLELATNMVENLRSTFKDVIEDTEWMDAECKTAAQLKVDNIATLLGFPNFVNNRTFLDRFYRNLEITTWDHYSNAKRLRAFQQAYTLNMLHNRDRLAWENSPFDVNAYYNRQNNRIIFPVAMLNPVFFQGSLSLLDYSRIGMVIAHEITHGFDSQGYLYDPDGVLGPWWTDNTRSNFTDKSQCFIEQYSKYLIPEINEYISGSGSLNENLADNGGLSNSFRAFKPFFSSLPNYEVFSHQFSPEQLYFIGYGTMWCNNESLEYLQSLHQTCESSSCHARASMRVNGVVSNMPDFAKAFNCPVDSPMNPSTKCKLW